jgi:hypothetical protein
MMEIAWDSTLSQVGYRIRLLTPHNYHNVFQYLPEYKVLICQEHYGAIYSLQCHIRKHYVGTAHNLKAVITAFSQLELLHPSQILLPPLSNIPFAALGEPLDVFLYVGDDM